MTIQLFSILTVGLILAVILISAFVVAFRQGLRLGLNAAKGNIPEPIKNPVAVVKEAIKVHKVEKEREEAESELDQELNIDYKSLLEAVKRGE